MRFSSAISTDPDVEKACHEAAESARAELGEGPIDLCCAFVNARSADKERVPAILGELLDPRALIGCSGGGIIGGGTEVEGQPALSITLGRMPGAELTVLHLEDGDLPDQDGPPGPWVELIGRAPSDATGFIVLPEPFSFGAPELLAGLDFAYPNAPKVGGIASGSQHPGGHVLFGGRQAFRTGCVVLAVGGSVALEARVAQGCKAIGAVGKISKAEQHYLMEIDAKPALVFLQEQLRELQGEDLELARKTPMFLGIGMDPFRATAPEPGDFLIRNIMDCDPRRGSLTIGDILAVGRWVQFHLRDADASAEDLRNVLERGERRRDAGEPAPAGALLFSCLGRGEHLYGEGGHDTRVFGEVVGNVALGGFFCNGEIGPVAGTTHLHGYTSSFAMFAERKRSARGEP